MPIKVLIPAPLRQYTDQRSAVEVNGETVSDALRDLVHRHGGVAKHLLDDTGAVRSFVNIYVNDEDIRHLDDTGTALDEDDVITIVPSVAGGR